jgi:hypothetical protein
MAPAPITAIRMMVMMAAKPGSNRRRRWVADRFCAPVGG